MAWAKLARHATITTENKSNAQTQGALIWDLPTRLFHWLLVACFAGSWITAEAGFDWTEIHFLFGYTTLGLVLFRISWGFLGNRYARFSNFVAKPSTVAKSIPEMLDTTSERHAGHSPYGGYAVVLLLYFALAQATSGLFISDDILYTGPYNGVVSNDLAGTLAWFHGLNFTLLQIMVGAHLVAILWYRLRKREALVMPMLLGYKRASFESALPVSALKAVGVILVCAAVIILLVQLAPEPSFDDYY